MKTIDLSGVKVDNVSMAEAVGIVEGFLGAPAPHLIVTPNPEIIVSAQKDEELKRIVNSASLRVPDGISMVVVSRILGTPLKERVTGIDLMLKLIEQCGKQGRKIFLLGGKPGIAQAAAARLLEKFPGINIVGTYHGYFKEDSEAIKAVKDAGPDVLFAGLGAGRQEKWLERYHGELRVPVAMVIGGSLDVISGQKRRAPKWMQRMYIEWLYRLFTEPERWKRQLALPKFLYLTLLKKVI